jgi:hypothetical protein
VRQQVLLGLALDPGADVLLQAAGKDGWSERLLSRVVLVDAGEVTPAIADLLRHAWERS